MEGVRGEPVLLRMFNCDLDEALQLVFLSLDPVSLKNSRLVCKAWNSFIRRRVWGSPRARAGLRGRLLRHWRSASARVGMLTLCKEVYSMACDDERVYCGTADQHIQVFCITSAKLIYERYCAIQEEAITMFDGQIMAVEGEDGLDPRPGVQLDLGKRFLAAITLGGVVSIWEKHTGVQLYLDRPHGKVGVFGVRVWGEVVITGAADASLVLLENRNSTWAVGQKVSTGTSYITHLDSDGDTLSVGTHTGVQLWKVKEEKNSEGEVEVRLSHLGGPVEEKGPKLVVWMLVISQPYILIVGGEEWGGVQVWRVATGELVRHFDPETHYHNLQINRQGLVTLTEIKNFPLELMMGYQPGDTEEVAVVVLKLSDLGNRRIKDADLWQRKRMVSQLVMEGEVNAVSNATHLVVSKGNGGGQLQVQDFWSSPIPKMTRLRSRRKHSKGEASTRCLVARESSPSIVEGMVHKKKSDHSLISNNKKLKIQ